VTGTLDLSRADAKLLGERPGDLAWLTAGAGDVDGDGNDDLLVGSTENGFGAAYLVRGPVSGTIDLSLADAKLVGEPFDDEHYAGCSVSGAGDADGDGNDDVLVGMCGKGDPYGIAYLVHGPVTGTFDLGLADAKLMLEPDYLFVTKVASAGDVDGDGFDDLLVGDPSDDEADAYAGAAYLVRGPVSGTVDLPSGSTKLIDAEDDAWYQTLGQSVSGAGDIDGDGNDDVLIGVPGDDEGGSGAGAVWVLLGPAPLNGTHDLAHVADAKLIGSTADSVDTVGVKVAGAGDVDLDGRDDVLVGAGGPAWLVPGVAYLVLSPLEGTMDLSRADIRFSGEHLDDGAGLGSAGDVDGDGRSDLLLGAPYNDEGGKDAGAAYLIYNGGL
jgi:hypothetical protein